MLGQNPDRALLARDLRRMLHDQLRGRESQEHRCQGAFKVPFTHLGNVLYSFTRSWLGVWLMAWSHNVSLIKS